MHTRIFFKKYNFLFKKNKNIFYKPNCLFQDIYHYKVINNNFVKFSAEHQHFNFKKIGNHVQQDFKEEPFRLGNLVDLNRRSFSLWLENRKLFKLFFLSDFSRRIRVVRMVSRLAKPLAIGLLKFFEFSISNLLVRTFFLCSYLDTHIALKEGLVFVNKKNCFNAFFTIVYKDVVEFIYTKNYFYFLKKKNIYLRKHLYTFRRKQAKFRSKNVSTLRYKKSFKYTQEYMFVLNSIPVYIEIDYQAFIFILISNQMVLDNTAYLWKQLFPLYTLRFLNWKHKM